MKLTLTCLTALVLLVTGAQASPPSVCERRDSAVMENVTSDPSMRFSFDNEGGLGNGGVCWWHSRFQRAVWYLAEFKPELQKPARAEATRIIDRIAHFDGVTEIPGYTNFYDFSRDFQDVIQRELNQWQARDGFINQAWLRGISGKARYTPRGAALRMENLYLAYETAQKNNEIVWLKLQMPGVVAHAALMLSMIRASHGGFELQVVDSNYPGETKTWRFRDGDTHIQAPDYEEPFMPFDGYERDLNKASRDLKRYCR